MIARKVFSILIAGSFFLFIAPTEAVFPDLLKLVPLSPAVFAQDLSKTVLPITQFKLKLKPKESLPFPPNLAALRPRISLSGEADFGTGFCLDPDCRLIGTSYHVAVGDWPHKIKGDEVIQRYLATGPDDDSATWNDIFSERPMKYTITRDLAIFELQHPLPHYHGIPFSLDELEIHQPVDIYCYPKESINPIRSLLQFHGAYKGKTSGGLLGFEYDLSDGKPIRGGASGGLVVNKTHQIVGVLSRVGLGTTGESVALAVPIQSLADFVNKVQPWMAQSLFPSASRETISVTSLDLYPKLVEPSSDSLLEHRPEEPAEVKLLREKAQFLVDGMKNYIAIQTVAWGSQKNKVPSAEDEYEVRVIEGVQKYREYPDGKKEFDQLPLPRTLWAAIGTANEWVRLPAMVGQTPKHKIHQFPDSVVDGHRVKVFQYRADVEDDVCGIDEITDLLLFTVHKVITTPCYGEVWTDEEFNILRISEHDEHMERYGVHFRDAQIVVTYGWLRRAGEAPRLVPLTYDVDSMLGKKLYWCRGMFKNYQVFTTQTKIGQPDAAQELPH